MEHLIYWYLFGSGACFSLILIRLILVSLFSRMNGDHIFNKNLKKVGMYRWSTGEIKDTKESRLRVVFITAIDTASSWVGFLILGFKLIIWIGASIRKIFEKLPDNLATISFPLSRTLEITPENVWARLFAMGALVAASKPSLLEIETALRETKERVVGFNYRFALNCLESLNVHGIEKNDLEHLKVILSNDDLDLDSDST